MATTETPTTMKKTDDKYIVFKREHVDNVLAKVARNGLTNLVGGVLNDLFEGELKDANVIRNQDIFAAPVLYGYASAVQTAIEVLAQHGTTAPEYLFEARDHFFAVAEAAHASPVKRLPDA